MYSNLLEISIFIIVLRYLILCADEMMKTSKARTTEIKNPPGSPLLFNNSDSSLQVYYCNFTCNVLYSMFRQQI